MESAFSTAATSSSAPPRAAQEPPAKRLRTAIDDEASPSVLPKKRAPAVDRSADNDGGGNSSRLTGVVKAFNMRLGLGKISCAETGRDVVVKVADLAGFDVGDEVSFLLAADPVLGTPRAVRLRAIDASDAEEDEAGEDGMAADGAEIDEDGAEAEEPPPRVAARPPAAAATPRSATPAAARPRPVAAAPAPARRAPPAVAAPQRPPAPRRPVVPGQRLTGSIKGVNKKLGIGGITCTETGEIVKVPIADLAGFEAGDFVSFVIGKNGRATDIEAD